MTGLAEDEVNWVTSGGSATQGSASEFNDQLNRARDNFKEGDAVSNGLNITTLQPGHGNTDRNGWK